jgi:murein L,D-transpeptidase YcbB/YkuD
MQSSADAARPQAPSSDTASASSEPASPTAPVNPDAVAKPASDVGLASRSEASSSLLTLDTAAALSRLPAKAGVDARDRAAVVSTYAARGGNPIWMTAKGARPEAMRLKDEIAKADDWGLKRSDFDLSALDAAQPRSTDLPLDRLADAEVGLSIATLKYARHARGGRVEPTEITEFLDRKSQVFDPRSVLEQIAAAAEPDLYLRKLHPRHAEFERLRQRYLAVRDAPTAQSKGNGLLDAEQLLANMEQWRWMPADLGAFHIWVNIPEQLIRVVRGNEVIHTERVIVGKADTQTPIFSDEMEQVIFHPFWGVPDSIKTNEVLPGLKRGRAILAKQNLKIQHRGKDINPATVDWNRTDIRNFHVFQPPGSGNVLGVVKFWLPNKHSVYLHDTPSKSLFKAATRAFSHGCVRVQDPIRLAEMILAEDRGMTEDRVQSLARKGAPENNQMNLARRIPVHITYFTVRADRGGEVSTFKDIYGHEKRISLALDGKMHLIKPVPKPKTPAGPVGRLVEISSGGSVFSGFSGFSGGSVSTTRPEWARRVFSGSDHFSGGN